MTIRLDHTIVPARDKIVSAEFFADIFGLSVTRGYFAQVRVNEHLTLDFADAVGTASAGPFPPPRRITRDLLHSREHVILSLLRAKAGSFSPHAGRRLG